MPFKGHLLNEMILHERKSSTVISVLIILNFELQVYLAIAEQKATVTYLIKERELFLLSWNLKSSLAGQGTVWLLS